MNTQQVKFSALKSLFTLDSYVEIFVPSTVNVDGKNDALCAEVLLDVRKKLSSVFGGATSYDATGDYVSDNGSLVSENVTIVRSWSNGLSDYQIDVIIRLAEHVKRILSQESVAIVIAEKTGKPRFYLV